MATKMALVTKSRQVCALSCYGFAVCGIVVPCAWIYHGGFGLDSLGPHYFVQLSSAGVIDVLVPVWCWAYSAVSV